MLSLEARRALMERIANSVGRGRASRLAAVAARMQALKFDPRQKRDSHGRWTDEHGVSHKISDITPDTLRTVGKLAGAKMGEKVPKNNRGERILKTNDGKLQDLIDDGLKPGDKYIETSGPNHAERKTFYGKAKGTPLSRSERYPIKGATAEEQHSRLGHDTPENDKKHLASLSDDELKALAQHGFEVRVSSRPSNARTRAVDAMVQSEIDKRGIDFTPTRVSSKSHAGLNSHDHRVLRDAIGDYIGQLQEDDDEHNNRLIGVLDGVDLTKPMSAQQLDLVDEAVGSYIEKLEEDGDPGNQNLVDRLTAIMNKLKSHRGGDADPKA